MHTCCQSRSVAGTKLARFSVTGIGSGVASRENVISGVSDRRSNSIFLAGADPTPPGVGMGKFLATVDGAAGTILSETGGGGSVMYFLNEVGASTGYFTCSVVVEMGLAGGNFGL